MLELLKFIKNKDTNKNDIKLIKDTINAFVSYTNMVIDMEIFTESIKEWSSTTEFILKKKDEERRFQHNLCISFCEKINELAEFYNYALYINTDNRHEVACFIGDTISKIYNKGIYRDMDEIIKDYSKTGKIIKQIDNIEELEL